MTDIPRYPLFDRYKAASLSHLDATARLRQLGVRSAGAPGDQSGQCADEGRQVLEAELVTAAAELELARGAYLEDPAWPSGAAAVWDGDQVLTTVPVGEGASSTGSTTWPNRSRRAFKNA